MVAEVDLAASATSSAKKIAIITFRATEITVEQPTLMPPRKKAKRLGINTHVVAPALVAFGEARAYEAFGPLAHTQVVKGVIKEQVGQGRGRTWRIQWETNDISTLPTRSIERDRSPDVLEMNQQPGHMLTAPTDTSLQPPSAVPLAPAASQKTNSITHGPAHVNHASDDYGHGDGYGDDDNDEATPNHPVAEMQPTQPPQSADHSQQPCQPQQSCPHVQESAPQDPQASQQSSVDSVTVHGVEWRRTPTVLDVDRPRHAFAPPPLCSLLGADSYYGFFTAAFPGKLLDALVEATSHNLVARRQRATTRGEMLRVIGALMALSEHRLPLREVWDAEYEDGDSYATYQYSSFFSLSRSRLEVILSALAVVPDAVANNQQADDENGDGEPAQQQQQQQRQPSRQRDSKLDAVEPAIKLFNDARREVRAGNVLVIDESMSRFVTKYSHADLMVIPRKPEPVGFELKSMADAESGVMLWLELQRTSVPNEQREWSGLGSNCGWTIRATQQYHCTGRLLIGDSAFACVKTAFQLAAKGLHFIGNVKNATTHFPKVRNNTVLAWRTDVHLQAHTHAQTHAHTHTHTALL